MSDTPRRLFMVLGNQLFAPEHFEAHRDALIFMAEDRGLATYVHHHQQKIVLFFAAMREHADRLREAGFEVRYHAWDADDGRSYVERLAGAMDAVGTDRLVHFEIEDRAFEDVIGRAAEEHGWNTEVLASPMFLTPRETVAGFLEGRRNPKMADFYREQRQRLGILVDGDGKPVGGQWSFDADNRKALPKDIDIPETPAAARTDHVEDVIAVVREHFADHPGDARDFWWPVTRAQALAWFERFLEERFERFGPYEDALSTRSATLFHAAITPPLNLGLVTPGELVEKALEAAEARDIPLQSLEGFVRQVIGWREFIRGIDRAHGAAQAERNHFDARRGLTRHWWTGETGIPPLDDAIAMARDLGWTHHIYRLMVLGNLMTLCEIRPPEAYRWFMEMYVDSSDWVMGPNVYGMALHSDGGIFATKPYICGSNYLRKMSDTPAGDWCDTVDGLYWRFIDRHRAFFEGNPRLALMPRALDRLSDARRGRIFDAAEGFLDRCTTTA